MPMVAIGIGGLGVVTPLSAWSRSIARSEVRRVVRLVTGVEHIRKVWVAKKDKIRKTGKGFWKHDGDQLSHGLKRAIINSGNPFWDDDTRISATGKG